MPLADRHFSTDRLARRCNEGQLTASERAEYETDVTAIDFVAVLQAKARALLARAEEYARGEGAVWLRLGVKGGNAPAYAFYAKAGFTEFSSQLEKKL